MPGVLQALQPRRFLRADVQGDGRGGKGPGIDRRWRTGWVRSNARRRSTPGIWSDPCSDCAAGRIALQGSKLRAKDCFGRFVPFADAWAPVGVQMRPTRASPA
jgi:hypothetical protein